MTTINIKVSQKAAERFSKLSEPEKNFLSKIFAEILEDNRTLMQVMDDMSSYAAKKGLTPEILDEILNDNTD